MIVYKGEMDKNFKVWIVFSNLLWADFFKKYQEYKIVFFLETL